MSQAFHGGGVRQAAEQFGLPADSLSISAPSERLRTQGRGSRLGTMELRNQSLSGTRFAESLRTTGKVLPC